MFNALTAIVLKSHLVQDNSQVLDLKDDEDTVRGCSHIMSAKNGGSRTPLHLHPKIKINGEM